MNKKTIVLAMNLMVFSTASMLPMQQLTTQEEQARRDHICHLSKANALGIAQYLENGQFSRALIDRDIAILEKDSQQAMKNKSWAEGYWYSWMIPGSVKSVAIGSGLGALAAGIATTVGFVLTYNIWNSSSAANFCDKIGSRVINSTCTNLPDYIDTSLRYYDARAQYLMQQSDYNRSILTIAPLLPFTFVATLMLVSVAKYSSSKLSNYRNRNAAFIQEMQERCDRNSIAIAQLKQIKYDAGF